MYTLFYDAALSYQAYNKSKSSCKLSNNCLTTDKIHLESLQDLISGISEQTKALIVVFPIIFHILGTCHELINTSTYWYWWKPIIHYKPIRVTRTTQA